MSIMSKAQYGQNYRGRWQYVNNYRNDFKRRNFRGTHRLPYKSMCKIFIRRMDLCQTYKLCNYCIVSFLNDILSMSYFVFCFVCINL